jgi:hypothetical protein
MKHTLPSVDQLKQEKCPAAIALMMHNMYALLPDAMMEVDGQKNPERVKYINELAKRLAEVRSFEGFKALGEFMMLETGLFDRETPLKEQFKQAEMQRPEFARKYGKLIDILGLDLPTWGDEDALKAMWLNARVATGENGEKIQWELIKEEMEKAKEEGRERKMTEEEQKVMAQQQKYADMALHGNTEVWHPVKKIARRLKEINDLHAKTTDVEWAAFEQEERVFVERFGLKGVRFPYAMSLENRREGMQDIAVNFAKIAKAMEIEEELIGFKGRMPVFYGGASSGSLGTYTYLSHTLYVLKGMGERATAHEWFHALDYDLSYRTGNSSFQSLGGAPSFSEPHLVSTFGDMKRVQEAMKSLMDGVKYGFNGGEPIQSEQYLANDGIFWTTLRQVYAKELFKWIPKENVPMAAQRFNLACQNLYNKEWSAGKFTQYMHSEYQNALALTEPATKERLLTDFDSEVRILSGLYDKLRENPAFFQGERSSFLNWFCAQMDDKNGRQYYTTPTEFIARLGEQYVFDKLGEPLKEHAAPQYVLPFEKEKIQSRFGTFIEEAAAFMRKNYAMTNKQALKP